MKPSRQRPSTEAQGEHAVKPLGMPPLADLSILRFLNVLLRFRATFLLAAVATAAVFFVSALFEPRAYSVVTSFIPERSGAQNATAGLAAQFGLVVPGNQSVESPQFYLELLKTHDMLNSIAGADYPIQNGVGPLERAYGITEPNPLLAREGAVRRLSKQLRASASGKTGIITATVTSPSPALSTRIAEQVLAQLRRFNAERRQTKATAEREFAEARMVEGKQQLTQAESRLEDFLQINRDYRGAPRLVFAQDRLARDVSMRQQLYTSLAEAYEQAKLEEVRQAAAFTVLQPPVVPLSPDPRGLLRRALFALFLGLVIGGLLAFARQYAAKARVSDLDEYSEFEALKRETIEDLRHPLRSFRSRGQNG